MRAIPCAWLIVALAGCPSATPAGPTVADGLCGSWRTASREASITAAGLTEISGVARSHRVADTLWMHEHQGAASFVVAVGTDGADRGTYSLVGAAHEDWEDIALGPCGADADACSCLYLADVGDNERTRDAAVVYRVPEPDADAVGDGGVLVGVEALWFRYPDGPRDAEALLVDPATGRTLVVTKAEADETEVFAFPAAPPRASAADDPVELERVAAFDLHDLGAGSGKVTAGDVSPRGRRVVLRTDEDVLVFRTPDGGDPVDALGLEPLRLAGPDGENGEGLAVSADGATLWLAGESGAPSLWSLGCASFDADADPGPDPLVDCGADR